MEVLANLEKNIKEIEDEETGDEETRNKALNAIEQYRAEITTAYASSKRELQRRSET